MAIVTCIQPQFIVDLESERDLAWPDGSFVYCKDTDKTYMVVEGSFKAVSGSGGTGAAWGDITGTLSAQTDLQSTLDLKSPLASPTFTGTITCGTMSAVGAIISSTSLTIGTGTIIAAKITATTGSFTALLTAGTASISGEIIGGTTITGGTGSFSGNFFTTGTASIGGGIIGGTTLTIGTVSATGNCIAAGVGSFGGALSFSTGATMVGERAYITFAFTSAASTTQQAVPFSGKVIDCWTTSNTTPRTCSGFTLRAGSAGTIYVATVALVFATAAGQQVQPTLTPELITTASCLRVTVTTGGTASNYSATVVLQRTA